MFFIRAAKKMLILLLVRFKTANKRYPQKGHPHVQLLGSSSTARVFKTVRRFSTSSLDTSDAACRAQPQHGCFWAIWRKGDALFQCDSAASRSGKPAWAPIKNLVKPSPYLGPQAPLNGETGNKTVHLVAWCECFKIGTWQTADLLLLVLRECGNEPEGSRKGWVIPCLTPSRQISGLVRRYIEGICCPTATWPTVTYGEDTGAHAGSSCCCEMQPEKNPSNWWFPGRESPSGSFPTPGRSFPTEHRQAIIV